VHRHHHVTDRFFILDDQNRIKKSFSDLISTLWCFVVYYEKLHHLLQLVYRCVGTSAGMLIAERWGLVPAGLTLDGVCVSNESNHADSHPGLSVWSCLLPAAALPFSNTLKWSLPLAPLVRWRLNCCRCNATGLRLGRRGGVHARCVLESFSQAVGIFCLFLRFIWGGGRHFHSHLKSRSRLNRGPFST